MFAKRVKLSHRVSTDLNEGLAGFFAQSWVDVRSRVRDVVLQHGHVQELFLHLLLGLVVERHQVVSQPAVVSLILGIQHQENEVESDGATNTKLRLVCNTATCGSVHREFQCSKCSPGQESVRQLDVLDCGLFGVPLGFHWVGSSQHGGAGVQLADDSSLRARKHKRSETESSFRLRTSKRLRIKCGDIYLCNGEGLLLHDLVQHGARVVAHLVELVDAADAVVAQDQRAGLQHQLPGLWVLHHIGGQTHSAGALS